MPRCRTPTSSWCTTSGTFDGRVISSRWSSSAATTLGYLATGPSPATWRGVRSVNGAGRGLMGGCTEKELGHRDFKHEKDHASASTVRCA